MQAWSILDASIQVRTPHHPVLVTHTNTVDWSLSVVLLQAGQGRPPCESLMRSMLYVLYHFPQAARMLKKGECELNLIVAHLGAGASITAIQNGKSVDTSMGLTPLEGCAA